MKKYLIFASAVACLAVSGCVKAKKDFADDQVSFSASTGALETRTDYGLDWTVGGQPVTYVNWVAGDKIKILSSTGSSDTYTVSEDHDGSYQQGISKGNVTPDGSGIAWGTGQQTFYAMYPANVSGSSLTSSTMTCVIPATWTPANETELGQLPYGYMFAKTTTSRTTSVSLTFNAKFTSFTFTLKNPTASAVTLSSLSLSSASKAMNGTYTVNTSNGSIGTLPTAGNNKSITVDFTSLTGGGLTVPAGTTANPGTKTFTLVAVPDSFDDLTVACTSSGTTKTMKLKHNGQFYSFAAGKKHNIAIELPDFSSASVSSFTILFGGGTESGQSAFETGGEQAEGTIYNHPISQGFNNENIKYLGIWSSLPANGSHNALQVFSDYIAIQDRGTSPAKGGIYFELSDTYNDYTPTKIEIECSAATGSKIKVYFNTDAATIPLRINDVQDVYSSGESGKKVLIYTQSTTPSIPTTALKDIKIINMTSSLAAINIYSVKVYY